ncbi:MAG: coproporphyrinogen III oxidase [Alphaproteobacteria bacterium]|jgi:oxygen-independent coproporphyrinogen-3 oxidase|nr:coproporphyrinogen III oxidase [Alphaproteobacteria bacterium]
MSCTVSAAPAPAAPAGDPGFGLYVHWPFCRAKCPYCDFNSHVRAEVDQDRWRRALLAELDHVAALAPAAGPLRSIFFGGGTPSLMPPATTAAVIDRAVARFGAEAGIEITLEANPTSVEAARFRAYRDAGVDRVSLGVQALNDADLTALGREHSAAEALAAVALAARTFPRFSFDLIYARPGQDAAAWEAELGRALDHAGDHLSLYQLTLEPGTRFHALAERGRLRLPPDDTQAELYRLSHDLLAAAGLAAYEVSNHARPGAESRHNLVYWRGGAFAGIGPGAHGRLDLASGRVGTSTERWPERWLDRVERDGHGLAPFEPLDAVTRLAELVMMGLRLAEGVPLARIEQLAGRPWRETLDARGLARAERRGHLTVEDGRLKATPQGRLLLDAVLVDLLP